MKITTTICRYVGEKISWHAPQGGVFSFRKREVFKAIYKGKPVMITYNAYTPRLIGLGFIIKRKVLGWCFSNIMQALSELSIIY